MAQPVMPQSRTDDLTPDSSTAPAPSTHKKAPKNKVKPRGSLTGWRLFLARLAVLIAWLAFWQVTVSSGRMPPVLNVSPADVATFIQTTLESGELVTATVATMYATLIAFVLASFVGVVVGIGLGLMPRTEKILTPYLDALNAMPRIALAPVFIIAFGITTSAKVALAFTLVVFILMSNSRAGIRSADPDVLRLSTVLGASKLQMFFKVMLPVAVPSIFAGLRLGLIYSLLGVTTAEIIGSKVGLGQLIMKYSGMYQLEGVFGILLVLAVLAAVINTLMGMLENWILRYQPPQDQ